MGEEYKEQLDFVLSCLNRKYQQLDGYKNTTAEMDALADGEDPTTFGIYLDMRENHIAQIVKLDEQMEQELQKLPPEVAGQVKTALVANGPEVFANPALTAIKQADMRNRELHARIVEMDKRLTQKVNGPEDAPGETGKEE